MKIGISAAKEVGFSLLKFIIEQGLHPSFVISHKKDSKKKSIESICQAHNIKCYDFDMNSTEFSKLLTANPVDKYFMLWFPTLLKQKAIKLVKGGYVNLHPSLLPYNKGMHPWYWCIRDNTPAGNTIHYIDEKIDNGSIIIQKEVKKLIADTGETMYNKLINEMKDLFKANWQFILTHEKRNAHEPKGKGTFHYSKELDKDSHINLEKMYKAKDILNILRARSFKNGDCAYFYSNNVKYQVRIDINPV